MIEAALQPEQYRIVATFPQLRAVANAALRHAIDAGQVVVVDWDAPARAARDMIVAEAVRSRCGELVGGSHIARLDLAALIAAIR